MKIKIFIIGVISTIVIQLIIFSVVFFNAWDIVILKRPLKSDVAVVEGWICDHAIQKAAEYIKKNNIKRIFVSGNMIEKQSRYFPRDNYAELGALSLRKELKGYDCNIMAIPVKTKVNRTLKSAKEVVKYLKDNEKDIYDIIILTENIHSRRSYLSYQKVGKGLRFGVVPLELPAFNRDDWIRSSTGVKRVLTEMIALSYNFFKMNYI